MSRAYPPDLCDEETMAYLVGLAPSTFRQYVAAGLLPGPVKIGNKHRWHRAAVVEMITGQDARRVIPKGILEAARGVPT